MRPLPEINPDTGKPVVTITFPMCPWACGAFAGERDCDQLYAEITRSLDEPLRVRWSK